MEEFRSGGRPEEPQSPVATKSSSGGDPIIEAALEQENNTPRGDVSRPDPSFMGKGQMDDFASLTDPSSVDRGGNVIAPAPTALPLTGQVPSDIPPEDAFKITPQEDIDGMGMNQLYNK